MNIINETISKVRELEKRLDTGLTHNSLSVIEIKKETDPNFIMNYLAQYSFKASANFALL